MGFSYGYTRAERAEHYHSTRDLVIMLADIVSRGGNFLLDIGPDADGTIPVIMEQRLLDIGAWLKINGEAIYGTRPNKTPKQWTAGEQPKVDYNERFESKYDVAALASKPAPGKASIAAFFTTKGNQLYAILPRWPGKQITIQNASAKQVQLLGLPSDLKFKNANGSVTIQLPDLPEDLLAQPSWTLKITQ
jgi:alpha-L-fucosidase